MKSKFRLALALSLAAQLTLAGLTAAVAVPQVVTAANYIPNRPQPQFARSASGVPVADHLDNMLNQPQPQPGLFTSVITGTATTPTGATSAQPTVVRERLVEVHFEQLGVDTTTSAHVASASRASTRLILNLFDDVTVVAALDNSVINANGGYSWIGHLPDIALSSAVLTVRDDMLFGSVVYPGGAFQIGPVNGKLHAIREIDQADSPADTVERVPPADSRSQQAAQIIPATDNGSIIDVLVAYTDDARAAAATAAGLTPDKRSAIEATIDQAINETNASYANSGIGQRLRLAGAIEVNYAETANSDTDKANLRNGQAGLQIVPKLRDAFAADLVTLIVEQLESGICGSSYAVATTMTPGFADNAYNVLRRSCAIGPAYSFGHELGHLMGAQHDWFVDDYHGGNYSYSHGFVYNPSTGPRWRTIMAYNDQCAPNTCTRIPFWSNPSIITNTVAMGVPSGTSTSCTAGNMANPPCDADDHSVLNNNAVTVSNFKAGNLSEAWIRPNCVFIPVLGCQENGTQYYPYDTLTEAAYRVAPGATVWIYPGIYPETLVTGQKTPRGLIINRPMTLRVNVSGTAVIGS
jgi:hypothetical protein